MKIGELAKRGGASIETIRFYERRGLLNEPPRTASGYRSYGEADLRLLRFIRQAKSLGFSLKEIGTILRLRAGGKCPCGEVTRIGEKHLRDLGRQIELLHRFHAELARAVKTWRRTGGRRIPGDAICILIERTMHGADGKGKR